MIFKFSTRFIQQVLKNSSCKTNFSTSKSKTYSTASNITNVEFVGGIKKITMNDFKSRNSLSIAMMESLIEHITRDEQNQDLRVIVLAAEGSIYSAGHNLKELSSDCGRSQHEKVFKLASSLMYSIIDSPVPVIAQVNGLAAAAGCQLVAQCDITICSDVSKFSTPGANFGLFCSTPGIPLARKVLRTTALNMLLTGEAIEAAEAKNCGLVTKVCSPQDLEAEVARSCEAIKSKSRSVIELGKKFFYKQVDTDIKEAYELGGRQMVENLSIVDGKEGVKSFIEKRKPKWSH